VKLHGSFPAHVPFVFTEEDYRTYPRRFSPFVNTVQQAMMETVFCLIGFSGDDPNFLHWSGWVRDNLGDSAPKIYLAGWLDLSSHRRRMLEGRSVVPIDLARHPQAATWAEHQRHQYATEWLLHSLERGQPYDVTQWPSPPNPSLSPVHERLQPVEDVTIDAPCDEPRPVLDTEPVSLPKQVLDLVEAWKHNRKIYPGWLIIPPSKHGYIGLFMDDWEQAILRAAPELTPIERLSAIQELVWRRENLLEPLSEKLEEAIQATLDNFDCIARRICGKEERSTGWPEIREAWRNLALTLLTAARQRFDRNAFERRLVALQSFLEDHPDVSHRVHHEKCLWALYALDFPALDELLIAWRPKDCDPAWMTRKAALLLEIDRNEEAVQLLSCSLSTVREAPRNGRTLAGPSREGWTLWLALAFEHGFVGPSPEVLQVPSVITRWQQLAALQCDAHAQKHELLDALRGDLEEKDGPLFDLGVRRRKTIRFSSIEYRRWVAARRLVRLCEVVGLPPSVGHMVVGSDILALAADHLIMTDYALAARLVLRLAKSEDDPTFNRVWSRPRIAAMPTDEVSELVGIVTKAMTYVFPRATGARDRSTFWVTRLRVLMEALSRLVLRLSPEGAEEVFRRGLSYYSMGRLAGEPWLDKSIDHLLVRSWEALPKCCRTDLILDVLSAPIVGLRGFASFTPFYPDPGKLLVNDSQTSAPAREFGTEGRWTEIVELILLGLKAGGDARKRAASRLVPLALWSRLTDLEAKRVAEALWLPRFTGVDALPSETNLFHWVFLLLPEPSPGLAEQRLRDHWFGSQEAKDQKRLNEAFWRVGTALSSLKGHKRLLALTASECAKLAAAVEAWVKSPVACDDEPFVEFGTREAILGLQSILPEIDLSPVVAEGLLVKVAALNQTHTPGFRLLAGLAKSLLNRVDDIAMVMRMGLSSDNAVVAEEAVDGLHFWLIGASEPTSRIPAPPGDLCREVGVMIANRRKHSLNKALQLACWIFADGSPEQRDAIAQMTLDGLRYLIEELRYDREHSEEDEVDVPLLRWGCAHLALAMSAFGYAADPTVARWAQAVQDDPLPEVRHAEGPTKPARVEENHLPNRM